MENNQVFRELNYFRRIVPIHKEKIVVISIGLLLPFLLVNLDFSKMWAFGDLTPFPTDIEVIRDWLFFSWRSEGLGSPNQPVSNYYLVLLMSSSSLGSIAAQKLLFVAPITISFLAFYWFQRSYGFSWTSSVLGALLYSVNPVTIASLVGGAIGELMTYAVFPLFALCIHKYLSNQEFRSLYIFIAGMLTLFVWNLYVAFWLTLFILVPVILVDIARNYSRILRLAPMIVPILLVLSPNIVSLLSLNDQLSGGESSFASTAAYTYRDISLPNIIRLSGNTGSAQSNEFLGFNELNAYTIFGYVIPAIASLSAFMFFKSNQSMMNLSNRAMISFIPISIATVIIILLSMANNPALADVNSIFSSLRNPVKIMYPLTFGFAFLFSVGVLFVTKIVSGRYGFAKTPVLIMLGMLLLIYNYPALDGTAGIKTVRAEQYAVDDKYYDLKHVMNANNFDQSGTRAMLLPWEYPTYLRVKSEMPNFFGIAPGVQQNNRVAGEIENVYNLIHQDVINKSHVLASYDTKYVIIDKSFSSYYEGQSWYDSLRNKNEIFVFKNTGLPWLSGDPLVFYDIFNSDDDFELVYEDASFAIFENEIEAGRLFEARGNSGGIIVNAQSTNLIENSSFNNSTHGWNTWPKDNVFITAGMNDEDAVLLLGQESGFTNMSQETEVKGNTQYQLQFDFYALFMTDLHAKVMWANNTDARSDNEFNKVDYIRLYEGEYSENTWHHVERQFVSPQDAKLVKIQFLASRIVNDDPSSMLIDNVSFGALTKSIIGLEETIMIEYERISPTHFRAYLDAGPARTVTFANSYANGWTASIRDDSEVIDRKPDPSEALNYFALPPIGSNAVLEIEYKPQQQYLSVVVISIAALLCCIAYILLYLLFSKRAILISNLNSERD